MLVIKAHYTSAYKLCAPAYKERFSTDCAVHWRDVGVQAGNTPYFPCTVWTIVYLMPFDVPKYDGGGHVRPQYGVLCIYVSLLCRLSDV